MFAKSAARDTLQGKAIQLVNEKWGDDYLNRSGRETIGIAVCKKKYNPFQFHLIMKDAVCLPCTPSAHQYKETSLSRIQNVEVCVERMFGCKSHHLKRKDKIRRHGVRLGWQSFGVWSLKKARAAAKAETLRLNEEVTSTGGINLPNEIDDEDNETVDDGSKTSKSLGAEESVVSCEGIDPNHLQEKTNIVRTITLSGDYTWKVKTSYDDVVQEIFGNSESDVDVLDNENVTGKENTRKTENSGKAIRSRSCRTFASEKHKSTH